MRIVSPVILILGILCIWSCDKEVYASGADKKAQNYTVSKTDVNRIICPAAIKEVIFSEEKGLTSKVVGNEVFIKFPVTMIINQETLEKTTTYSSSSAEVFLVCGEETYNLILTPAKISSQTIEIQSTTQQINEINGKDTEEMLGALIGLAIENDIPGSFKTTDKNISYNLHNKFRKLDVIYRKVSKGSGYVIKEFHIYSPDEVAILPVELLSFPEVENALAVCLTSEKFKGWVRGFVIEASR